MMGAEDAGKTSTVSSLPNKKFCQNQETTVGVAINCCIVYRIKVTEWRQTEIEYQLQELLNFYNVKMKKCILEISKKISNEHIPYDIPQQEEVIE